MYSCLVWFEYGCFLFKVIDIIEFIYQLTDAVENLAHVLHCGARTNLTLSEATIMKLIVELTKHLNSLIEELSSAVRIYLLFSLVMILINIF